MTTSNLLVPVLDDTSLGPAMRALPNDRQRAFVRYLTLGMNQTRAAAEAGYVGDSKSLAVMGHRLAHAPAVLAAVREEADKVLRSSAILAADTLRSIAGDIGAAPRDRIKAAEALLNRADLGVTHETKVTVEVSEASRIKSIRALAQQLNLNAQQLLGSYGYIVDADFEVVSGPDEFTVYPNDPNRD